MHNIEKKEQKRQQTEIRQIEQKWAGLMRPQKDPYREQHEAFLSRTGICEICGKAYTVREYMESCGSKKANDNGVCSAECRRIKKNKQYRASHKRHGVKDNHRARAKKNGCKYDPSVNLKKLIQRDGLKCAICGGECDPNDRGWSQWVGPMSPSLDHIIPLAKGGGHTWDNVQVAHMICNSRKKDTQEVV